MKTTQKRTGFQSGQAILVVALVMVGLIGALGLAIDGGGMAFLFRDAQNAADSAALAAAYARCTNGDINTAALTSAEDNGFANAGTTSVTVVPDATDPNIITVNVRAMKPAYFIQIVYPNGLEVTASATALCTPAVSGTQASNNQAFSIMGLGPTGGISATCHGTCEPAEGSNIEFDGNVYSSSGSSSLNSGNGVSFTNGAAFVGNIPTVDPLAYLDIADYAPNGTVWNNIPSDRRTYLQMTQSGPATVANFRYVENSLLAYGNRPAQDEWQVINPALLNGLYYVEGNIVLDLKNQVTNPFSIVATGRIDIIGARRGVTAYAQANNILAYTIAASDNCNDNALAIDTGSGAISGNSRGIVYAPNGQIEVLYRGGNFTGTIVGKWVDWWGYDSGNKTTFVSLPLDTPPVVALLK